MLLPFILLTMPYRMESRQIIFLRNRVQHVNYRFLSKCYLIQLLAFIFTISCILPCGSYLRLLNMLRVKQVNIFFSRIYIGPRPIHVGLYLFHSAISSKKYPFSVPPSLFILIYISLALMHFNFKIGLQLTTVLWHKFAFMPESYSMHY